MTKIVQTAILGALAVGMIGCATVRIPQAPPGPSVRVLSYNVHEGGGQRSNTLAVILKSKADVVVMQESSSDWIQFVQPAVSGEYPHIQSCYKRLVGFPNGFSILSKWPFKELAFMDDTNCFYGAWLVEIQSPMGPVLVLSVHLAAPVDKKGHPGIVRYLRTPPERREKVKQYFARVPPGLPLIVLGDFNEGGGGDAVEWLEKQGLTDALPLYDLRTPTWKGSMWSVVIRFRLDHILYSSDLACYNSGVIKGGGSDHRAIWAVLGPTRDDPTLSSGHKRNTIE